MDKNPISEFKTAYDAVSITNEINERRAIIDSYRRYGYLDRDNAIRKIQDLRVKDVEVASVTSAKLAVSKIPFTRAPDQSIIAELEMQMNVLTIKLANMSLNNS